MVEVLQRNLLVIAILISSSVSLASATYQWAPIQHEERVPRITDLGQDSKSPNGTLQDKWMETKSLKTMLKAQVVKYLDDEGDDTDETELLSEGPESNSHAEVSRNITDKISNVLIDVVQGLHVARMAYISDYITGNVTKNNLLRDLQNGGLSLSHYYFNCTKDMKYLEEDVKKWRDNVTKLVYVIDVRKYLMEEILLKIQKDDKMIRRHIYYIFISPGPLSRFFQQNILEAMKIIVIAKSRPGVYQILYNQASSNSKGYLERVNWWSLTPIKKGLFQYPLLPPALKVYSNFHGRNLIIPILHKPPWNFVYYDENDTIIRIESGRDEKLRSLLASKLNFRYSFIDAPDRNHGSFINGSYTGALGLVTNRTADMFMGDLSLTYERYQAVEFTFFTLADSEAFLTHAPGTLNEALALIRPFHWKVWPPLILSAVIAGPVLYLIIKLQLKWRTVNVSQSNLDRLFSDCIWFILVILLKQNGKYPSYTSVGRMMALLLSLSATYVIVDLYSANLTSILARPRKEQPIRNMEQLVDAMKSKQYQTVVEKNSASQSMLENGTGELVMDLWQLMKRQETYLIDSNEEGMQKVKDNKYVVFLGGRETLFYDAKRFGSNNYHLGEKLNTRYSAIVVPMGCPYLDNFNIILLRLFEAGIIDKITDDEYQELVNRVQMSSVSLSTSSTSAAIDNAAADVSSSTDEDLEMNGNTVTKTNEDPDDKKHKALSMKPLQGCFYILLIGYVVSTVVFLTEILHKKPALKPGPAEDSVTTYSQSKAPLYPTRWRHSRRIKPRVNHYPPSMWERQQ